VENVKPGNRKYYDQISSRREFHYVRIGVTSITVMEDSRGNGMKILLERQPVVMHRVIICQRTIPEAGS
jgi:hypothetical protein